MKKLFTMVSSAMLFTAGITVYGQSAATLAKNDQPARIQATKSTASNLKIEKAPLEVAPVNNASFTIIKRTTTETKVGPNGEDLIIKGNRFYYLDEKGKKVKVRKSELKEMAKHS